MRLVTVPAITRKQTEILDLLYTHRFLTRTQIQALLKHKDKKTINLWLKDLRAKDYINWIYDKTNFAAKTNPAIYYLGINGIRHLRNRPFPSDQELRKRYREHHRSQSFIDRCIAIADCCLSLEAAREEGDRPESWYFYETAADYASDSYYHFLMDNESIRPNLCFSKELYDGLDDPHAVESYLLEIFDATLPRYRLRHGLKKYVSYLDEEMEEWRRGSYGDPLPIVLLVCANTTDLIYAKRRTRGPLSDIWEYDDEQRPHVRFTTIGKLKQEGIVGEIWEEV